MMILPGNREISYTWRWSVLSCFSSYCMLTRGHIGGGGVLAMAGVQGKVAFGLSHFCVLSFSKKV